MKRISEPEVFMSVAEIFAKRSTCLRVQVGAVIVSNGRIVSTGYNGTSHGSVHCCDHFASYPSTVTPRFKEDHKKFSEENEIHAEQNAIAFAAKSGIKTEKCEIYTTVSPCLACAKLIIAAGIKKVIFKEKYDRDVRGIDLLHDCGVEVYFKGKQYLNFMCDFCGTYSAFEPVCSKCEEEY